MGHRFVDIQGLAGAWTLGTVQTGSFDLVGRVSLPGGWGDQTVEDNRALLGDGWEQQVGQSFDLEPVTCSYAAGTPPCSGFSLLNTSKKSNTRGSGAAINECMKELVRYAAKCKGEDGLQGPQIVSFESVQGAFKQGRDLMQELREILSRESGNRYSLTHVLMSGSTVGSAQMRHRYYFVAHRIPFGVEHPEPRKVVTYEDAIGDLQGLELTWEPQKYTRKATTDFQREHRAKKVTAHQTIESGSIYETVSELIDHWEPGDNIDKAIARRGEAPDRLKPRINPETGLINGWQWPQRIRPDRPGYVLTGGGIGSFVHWSEPRLLTAREASRLMGYPDDWSWDSSGSVNKASMLIGKCCPVQSGRWISEWVAAALDGNPGSPGTVIGEDEYLFNCTNDYRDWPVEVSQLTK